MQVLYAFYVDLHALLMILKCFKSMIFNEFQYLRNLIYQRSRLRSSTMEYGNGAAQTGILKYDLISL